MPGHRTVHRDGLPALVPDAAAAEHLVVLGLLLRSGPRRRTCSPSRRRRAASARPRVVVGHLDTARLEDRRHDVGRVVVLRAHLALGREPRRPVDDERVADAALVRVALEHPVRRRERHRPPGRVVVVGVGAAELVDHGEVLRLVVGVAAEDLALVDRSVGAALTRCAVVGAVEDQRVLELARLLEVVDDPADLRVGVLREPGVHLRHAAEHRLLLVGQLRPRPHEVGLGEGAVGHRVHVGELGAGGQDAALDHARQHPLAVGLVAVVERALVLVDVLLRRVVRRVVRAGAEPQVPGLVRARSA